MRRAIAAAMIIRYMAADTRMRGRARAVRHPSSATSDAPLQSQPLLPELLPDEQLSAPLESPEQLSLPLESPPHPPPPLSEREQLSAKTCAVLLQPLLDEDDDESGGGCVGTGSVGVGSPTGVDGP